MMPASTLYNRRLLYHPVSVYLNKHLKEYKTPSSVRHQIDLEADAAGYMQFVLLFRPILLYFGLLFAGWLFFFRYLSGDKKTSIIYGQYNFRS